MAEFRLHFEWEESPRVRTPELAATWARLEIYANEQPITKVEAQRTQSIRTGIYVPLFPVAEWLVANWFFLWDEWRADAPQERHSLLAAREGFALPNLSFHPTESQLELRWHRTQAPLSGLEFLAEGSAVVRKAAVREECTRLVEAVVERLVNRSVDVPQLVSDWRAVLAAANDPEQRAFCERAARLGCDPFDISQETANQIEGLGLILPEPLLDDFCDAIHLDRLASGARTVREFIDHAASTSAGPGRWRETRAMLRLLAESQPWKTGYAEARFLRNHFGDSGPIKMGIEDYLGDRLGQFQVDSFEVATRVGGITAPGATGAPVFGCSPALREESKRFLLCRALSDHLVTGLPSLVTSGQSEHQQRNRAFAAEFLAPAEALRSSIHGGAVGEDELGDLAAEYRVSEIVIRHQIQNHRLASIAG